MQEAEYKVLYEQEETFWWYSALHRLIEERVRERSRAAERGPDGPPGPGLDILDAGCGTGGMLANLRPFGRVRGIDMSPLALAFARRRGSFPLSRASVTRLPFRPSSFDLVVSLDVIYHSWVENDLDALREFRRVLRPGGSLILNLPAFESLRSSHDLAIQTARRYSKKQLRALLKEAGFEPIRITFWNSLLFPALALVRTLRKQRKQRPQRKQRKQGRRSMDRPPMSVPVTSDVTPLPRWLNQTLRAILGLEIVWLRRFDLPIGLSLLAVARPTRDPR